MIWIILTTILSTGICTAGGIFFGLFLSNRKKDRMQEKLIYEKEKKIQRARRKNLNSVYFELKDNIFLLSNIQEFIKENNIGSAAELLEEIRIEQVFNLSRNIRLNRTEFELVDELYSSRLFKNKIGFFISLYTEDKLSLLELRAGVEKFLEKLKAIENKFKEVFIDIE